MLPNSETLAHDRMLLRKIAAGDEIAFKVVFETYRKKVFAYAVKIIKSEVAAEDVLLDVFLKIWQHQDLTGIENLESYLKTTTRNTTLKVLRRRQLELKVNYEMYRDWHEDQYNTEEAIDLNDASHILQEAISLLPPQQKLVYTLCREEGLKYSEAAERLSLSPLTVKTHMQHALRFLRKYLTRYHGDVIGVVLLQILLKK
jgi:RNA polymerase sigma-70 factor (family 1)